MRVVLLAVVILALVALPPADARTLEQIVYLHDVGGLHLTPPTVHAKVGDTVKLTVQNDGTTEHDLLVCGDGTTPVQSCKEPWGFTPRLAANDTGIIAVDLKKPGTFDYYCTLLGHKGSSPGSFGSMWGTFVVRGENDAPLAPFALLLAALGAVALLPRRSA